MIKVFRTKIIFLSLLNAFSIAVLTTSLIVPNNLLAQEEEDRGDAFGKRAGNPSAIARPLTSGLRTSVIQVHIAGEITQPATYLLEQPSRLTTAIQAAGGVKASGSERRITIKNVNSVDRIVDLTKFKTTGDLASDPYLFENDTVFVPLKEKAVQVSGPVKRPGEYELIKETSLKDLIALAGGLTTGVAKYKTIRVVRIDSDKEGKKVFEIPFESKNFNDFVINNGDVISIPHVFTVNNKLSTEINSLPNDQFSILGYENRVFVVGGVKKPGVFPFNPHYKLNQYYALAGGGTILAKKKIKVVSLDGTSRYTSPNDNEIIINPGDTLEVIEKKVSTEFWIGFLGTIASISLSAVAILK